MYWAHVRLKVLVSFVQVVINGLYSSENNVQASFDSPVKVRHFWSISFFSPFLYDFFPGCLLKNFSRASVMCGKNDVVANKSLFQHLNKRQEVHAASFYRHAALIRPSTSWGYSRYTEFQYHLINYCSMEITENNCCEFLKYVFKGSWIIQCCNVFHFQSVALDPEFSKKRTKMYVTGGTKVCTCTFENLNFLIFIRRMQINIYM